MWVIVERLKNQIGLLTLSEKHNVLVVEYSHITLAVIKFIS